MESEGSCSVINSHNRDQRFFVTILCFVVFTSFPHLSVAPGGAGWMTFALILFKETDSPKKLTKDMPPLSLDTSVRCVCL